ADSVAVQPDGKIVVAGGTRDASSNDAFALARYNADGSLDTSFNGTGKVTTAIGSDDFADGVALQPDGKIVAAGYSYDGGSSYDFALARYNADGSLDTSFNGTGTLTTPFGPGNDDANALAVQPD